MALKVSCFSFSYLTMTSQSLHHWINLHRASAAQKGRKMSSAVQLLLVVTILVMLTFRSEPFGVHAFAPLARVISLRRPHKILLPTRTVMTTTATTANFVVVSPQSPATHNGNEHLLAQPHQHLTLASPSSPVTDQTLTAVDDDDAVKEEGDDVSSSSSSSSRRPTLETWKRRLITKEDKFHLHKMTGISFMVSSTMIMVAGGMTKFSAVPHWLYGPTLALVWSGWIQLYTSLIMTRQFRSRRDEKAAFLITAIGSSLTNLLALWFSPFCPKLFVRHPIIPHAIVAMNTLWLWMPMWAFLRHPKDTIRNRQPSSEPINNIPSTITSTTTTTSTSKQRQWRWNFLIPTTNRFILSSSLPSQLRDTFAYFVQIPIINVAASRMVLQLHAHGRDYFLSSWILKGTVAQNMAYIYYPMVVLSMASNYVALTATLRDKHLISQTTESIVMTILGAVSIFLLTRIVY